MRSWTMKETLVGMKETKKEAEGWTFAESVTVVWYSRGIIICREFVFPPLVQRLRFDGRYQLRVSPTEMLRPLFLALVQWLEKGALVLLRLARKADHWSRGAEAGDRQCPAKNSSPCASSSTYPNHSQFDIGIILQSRGSGQEWARMAAFRPLLTRSTEKHLSQACYLPYSLALHVIKT